MDVTGAIMMAKRILEKDYQGIKEDCKQFAPVTRTDDQTWHLLLGADLYIRRILEASERGDAGAYDDLYWAIVYLFVVLDEKKENLSLEKFEEKTHCIRDLAHKYRPEICK